ncbi:hypothetical protein CI109_102477 [Kwoniella shandongensis]|uniref:Ribonuclease P/MRP protein subunit POP5 n=1 Tax=Kwoniella shandongensis TaxID=1734106 RepID=A0A5M6BZL1_9TREE|nr:uncharacterized protein CI109_003204 [Kwoniella shandongensis]KAA5528306.1 hypothetical protein CI109_003204 [Kwoniella shandongensis]
MVRFKNRYLLVEFLLPSSLEPTLSSSSSSTTPSLSSRPNAINDDDGESDDDDDDEEEFTPFPKLPFMLPSTTPDLKLGDEGGSAIYKAVRNVVQDVFGDEGWGRIASSFRVLYHSPLTTLTFFRIARPHYRLLWSALTFITTLNQRPIIPRVVGVSGTIRKMQNRGIAYHREVVARLVAASVEAGGISSVGGGLGGVEKTGDREREEMGRLTE